MVVSLDQLKTAIWIYDIDNACIHWSNAAGLKLWEAKSLSELRARDFDKGSSDAVRTSLVNYQKAFQRGETFTEIWTITPKGIVKEPFLIMTGHLLEDGRMAMRCEAIEPDLVGHAGLFGPRMIMSSYYFDGRFISSNPPFKQEVNEEEINLPELVADPKVLQRIYDDLNINNAFEGDVLCKTHNGKVWYRFTMHLLQSDIDRKGKILLTQHNIHDRKLKEFAKENDSSRDHLTGLLNRRGLLNRLNELCEKETPFLLYYIDLDGFKMINDSFGHDGGDKILQWIAEGLSSFSRSGQGCRFGGDEFIWICPLDQLSVDETLLRRHLLDALSRPYHGDLGVIMEISASIGCAMYPKDASNGEELIACADSAMYMAKLQGKRQVVTYEPGMEEESKRQGRLAQHLAQAMFKQEFSLRYQEIYDVKHNKLDSVEASLCWNNEAIGLISTKETLQVAKAIGLIQVVEGWIIEQALSDLPLLRSQTNPDVRLSINISGEHFAQPDFITSLEKKIQKANLKPEDLIVELTETTLLKDVEYKAGSALALEKLGVGISIDEFGIGNSCLADLHRIPADIIKIDKSFIPSLKENTQTIEFIHKLATSLGIKTVIEGVETEKQKEKLLAIGIQLQQGSLYSNSSELFSDKLCP